MPFVIAILGASGSGKTNLMELLHDAGGQYSIHIKATDRKPRQYDDIEIKCVRQVDPKSYDYIYQTYGFKYGIQRSQIDKAISENRYHFIICNDISTIKSLKRDYGKILKVIFLTFDAPKEKLLEIQQSRKINDDEIELRFAKITTLYRIYAENTELFDGVLKNFLDESLTQMKRRMESLLIDFTRQKEKEDILNRSNGFENLSENELHFQSALSAQVVEPGYIFVIMAMKEDDPELEDVHTIIKSTCSDLKCKAERVDDIQFTGQITEKIQGCIRLAELVIADLTYGRPNVYYEVGYADACEKPLLLIAKKGKKIPFDLQGNKVLFYRNITDLIILLKKALRGLRK